jgi:two-component system chemotaxis response regulator CheY
MRAARPDVVLSALYLPDRSGTELLTAMRADPLLKHVAFILISSETRPQALDPIRQSGVCGIVPKPFTSHQLTLALNATVDYLGTNYTLDNQYDLEACACCWWMTANARKFMRRVLENLGISHIIEASDGKEGAAVLEGTMVDLIITDYNMPEMDGREFVEYVRTRSWQRSVPILMVTSETSESRLAAVEEAGVSGSATNRLNRRGRQLLGRMLEQNHDRLGRGQTQARKKRGRPAMDGPAFDQTGRVQPWSSLPSAVVLKPPSTYMISPVMPLARSEHRKAAALPTSSMVTLRRSGALRSLKASSLPKLPMPEAASVLIGPAEMALTRVPSGPSVTAM